MLAVGVLLAVTGAVTAARGSLRTRYRPDPWRIPEWAVLGAGVTTVTTFLAASWLGVAGMDTPVDPPAWPSLPMIALLGVLIAATPAWTAPRLPVAQVVDSRLTINRTTQLRTAA
jgi:energy-coupling factor transport system permease protein